MHGRRVENNLYHRSCIDLMVDHGYGRQISGFSKPVPGHESWGLSPVTRAPIDGFEPVPVLSDAAGLARFTDWRQSGKIAVDDLAILFCALMPIDESLVTNFLRKTFKVQSDNSLTQEELTKRVLPYLQAKCPDMCFTSESSISTPLTATAGLKKLQGVKHLCALRSTCKKGRQVADSLLVYELILHLQRVAKVSTYQAAKECPAVTESIAGLASEGSTVACSFIGSLFDFEDDELSRVAAEMLPKVSRREPWKVFHEIAAKLQKPRTLLSLRPPPINTRLAVVSGLIQNSSPGNERIVALMAGMSAESNHRMAIGGMEALGSVAKRGDQVAIKALLANMDSTTKAVAKCAEETLSIVAMGDSQTIDKFLSDFDCGTTFFEKVRAIDALGSIAARGNANVVKALSVFLGSGKSKTPQGRGEINWQDDEGKFSECKYHAMAALGNVAQKGDRSVMKTIFDTLSRSVQVVDAQTAFTAVRSFCLLTEKGDKWAIEKLNSVFDERKFDSNSPFRRELKRLVLELFAEIGKGGDPLIFRSAMVQRHDGDQVVAAEAIRTAGKTWHISEDPRVHNLEAIANSSLDAVVRREAEAALASINVARKSAPVAHDRQPQCGCTVM
jgi:hypothetical protein